MSKRFCGENAGNAKQPLYVRLLNAGIDHYRRDLPCGMCGFNYGQEYVEIVISHPFNTHYFLRVDRKITRHEGGFETLVAVTIESI